MFSYDALADKVSPSPVLTAAFNSEFVLIVEVCDFNTTKQSSFLDSGGKLKHQI